MFAADDVGASPSGKAPVFGSGIRRFESFRPSQFHLFDKLSVCRERGCLI